MVISPNEMNRHLQTIVVAPMTTTIRNYPTRVQIVHQKKKGAAAIDQIRIIDKTRIINTLGHISDKEITSVKLVLQETFVD